MEHTSTAPSKNPPWSLVQNIPRQVAQNMAPINMWSTNTNIPRPHAYGAYDRTLKFARRTSNIKYEYSIVHTFSFLRF